MNREWQYQLVADVPDAAEAEQLADEGRDVLLIRSPVGDFRSWERDLRFPDGEWSPGMLLSEEHLRGTAYKWFFPIGQARARVLVRRWFELGRLARLIELESRVDDDIERQLAEVDARHAARVQLRTASALSPQDAERIRAAVLDGPGAFRADWLAQEAKQTARAEPNAMPLMLIAEHARRVAEAFRAAGAAELRGIAADPTWQRMADRPEGFALEPAAVSLRAFNEQGVLGGELIVDDQLRCAVLVAEGYGLVAGPASFVAAVLGRPVVDRPAAG